MRNVARAVRPLLALLALLAGCATAPPPRPQLPSRPAIAQPKPTEQSDYLAVLAYAVSLRGVRYRAGGDSPATGFDCSGFVRHVYGQLGVSLPRDTAAMATALAPIAAGDRQAGDLVFFNTTGKPYSHVGIYLGNDRFVHAPSKRTGQVMVSNLTQSYWRTRFTGIRRAPAADRVAAVSR
jgi:cell wall-associated NlpC family hydrolase